MSLHVLRTLQQYYTTDFNYTLSTQFILNYLLSAAENCNMGETLAESGDTFFYKIRRRDQHEKPHLYDIFLRIKDGTF